MRIILVVAAGLGLAGCSSLNLPSMPSFMSSGPAAAPAGTTIQLESLPVGAEAKTSTGQSCKTPCALPVPNAENFTVTFSLAKYKSETVPVQVTRQQADTAAPDSQGATSGPALLIEPNPIYAELQPGGPAPKAKAAKTASAAKAKRPRAADEDASPFPPPPSR